MKETPTSAEIIIADTQILIIEGLKTLLSEKYTIGNIVTSLDELQRALAAKIPHILILDYSLLDFNEYAELRKIKQQFNDMVIIILSYNLGRNDVMEFHSMGIKNILHKSTDQEELFECIDCAVRGKKYYSGVVLDMLFEANEKKETTNGLVLTTSEIEIVRLIAQGLTNKEIAVKKFLSIHTIMTHRRNILRKAGVSNASELIMFAIKSGIIDNIEYHI
jgi:DNA-binding NarL/FixJ family response regulator